MKKILLGFIFLSLSSLIYSNELWNGLKFGMTTLEASRVLSERIEAKYMTTSSFNSVGWSNRNLLEGTDNNMRGTYKIMVFRTFNNSYFQTIHDTDTNIRLYYNQNNIIIGIRIYWNLSHSYLLQKARNDFGKENRIVQHRSIYNILSYYYIWETNDRIIQLGEFIEGTGEMLFLDKSWYNANSFNNSNNNPGVVF
jgi:hypothetical protein